MDITKLAFFLSNDYQRIQERSQIYWKSQRYKQICKYLSIIPPPLNILDILFKFSLFFLAQIKCKFTKNEEKPNVEETTQAAEFYFKENSKNLVIEFLQNYY